MEQVHTVYMTQYFTHMCGAGSHCIHDTILHAHVQAPSLVVRTPNSSLLVSRHALSSPNLQGTRTLLQQLLAQAQSTITGGVGPEPSDSEGREGRDFSVAEPEVLQRLLSNIPDVLVTGPGSLAASDQTSAEGRTGASSGTGQSVNGQCFDSQATHSQGVGGHEDGAARDESMASEVPGLRQALVR